MENTLVKFEAVHIDSPDKQDQHLGWLGHNVERTWNSTNEFR